MKFLKLIFTLLFFVFHFAYADSQVDITTELVIRTSNDWSGTQLPPYLSSAPEVAMMRYTIPPKAVLPIHMHPAINAAYVMSGEVTVVKVGGGEKTFRKGDAIVETVNTWHYGTNQGTEPAELIVFYATTKDQPLAIKKTAP
jgi:quercetin dioxygenase-like cupin family protein